MTIRQGKLQAIGVFPSLINNLGVVDLTLNAANTWQAAMYSPANDKTLDEIEVYCPFASGTAALRICQFDIFSASAGDPASSIFTKTASDADPDVGWIKHSAIATALTAGTLYSFVHRNTAILPGTDNFRLRYLQTGGLPYVGLFRSVTDAYAPFERKVTTDAGTTWSGENAGGAIFRLKFSDGTYDGFAIENSGSVPSSAYVYGERELGVYFTTDADASLRIAGLGFNVFKIGSPAGSLQYKLYEDTSLVGTTAAVVPANIGTGDTYIPLYFASPILVAPGTLLRATIDNSLTTDTSSNVFLTRQYTIKDDAASKALWPMGVQRTYFDGSAWAQSDINILPFHVLLDPDDPYGASGGGGGASMLNVGGGQLLRAA